MTRREIHEMEIATYIYPVFVKLSRTKIFLMMVLQSDILDYDPVRQQLEIELESLHSRLAHIQAHNNVLAITLEDSKNQSDR